ncbi:hypothetical protein IFM89_001944 [Coptis chinensis]|uniref:U3 small nucleolar ribonucleoprotein protein MPP10 n=1 Tax=Coptis chinensis TaxID=261450 RepID=A0A835IXK1_9MAGN|nr:hypothetical protein IFM89_001944 [Coptis chinensis]
MAKKEVGSVEALNKLKQTDPPLFLTPSTELSQTARKASQYLFSSLKPFCPKVYFQSLYLDGYVAEQIWQQIDLQCKPLVKKLKGEVIEFEKNPDEVLRLFGVEKKKGRGVEIEDGDEDIEDVGSDENEEEGEDEEDEEEEEGEDEEEEEGGGEGGVEDRFLKLNELEQYMEEDEAREYGGEVVKSKVSKKKKNVHEEEEEEEEDEEDEDDEDEDDELGDFGDDGEDGDDKLGNARYEDFFGGKKKKSVKRQSNIHNKPEDEEQEDDKGDHKQTKESLSTHEKELQKLHSKIEQMEKANLDPKAWTMQGEVTATKRPKNSALEVDLDFEHNVRPLPVITEEVTASLEDLIKERILEGRFDDAERAASLPSKRLKELKEMDENKSKKGLAEIYEEEYVHQTGLGTAPLSSSDQLKKEAQLLFDKLCLKLDGLSHSHFRPKPVIEDMSIQTNVPALAMEEIAPVAVSDVAMLAPEEVFAGKGDIKEEAELTQEERKRRRANKKRKYKVEASKRLVNKVQGNRLPDNSNGTKA